jgi:putative ABC transport system ATP-binding protein
MLIEAKQLAKIYSNEGIETPALLQATFQIDQGEFVSIMGPSGSGKSTLMHILGLLDRSTGGEYRLEGKDVVSLSDDELARLRNEEIGFVFQAFNLLPRTSVFENVELPLLYDRNGTENTKERVRRLRAVNMNIGFFFSSQLSESESLSRGRLSTIRRLSSPMSRPAISIRIGIQVMRIFRIE